MKSKASLQYDGQELTLARTAFLLAARQCTDPYRKKQFRLMALKVKAVKMKFHQQAFIHLCRKYKIQL